MSNFIFKQDFSGFSRFSGFFGRRGLKPRLREAIFCRSRSPEFALFEIRRSQTTEGDGNRSAGACPPRSLRGEGQALALREGWRFFRSAGACPPRTLVPYSVGQDRPILTRSGSGEPELRSLGLARDRPSPYGYPFPPVGAVSNRAYGN